MDSLSRALSARRGKSLSPQALMLDNTPGHTDLNPSQDPLVQGKSGHPIVDQDAGLFMPATALDQSHIQEHTPVRGETSGQPPLSPGNPMDMGALDDDLVTQLTDNASHADLNNMMKVKPRSLGERAKMMALQEKYEKEKK